MRALVIFIGICVLASASAQSHDLALGNPGPGDVILYNTVEWKYGIPFFVRTSKIDYPPSGQNNLAIITGIFVKDHRSDGTGGYPSIEYGGIGQNFVSIKLTSQRGRGFGFDITIYGYYYNVPSKGLSKKE